MDPGSGAGKTPVDGLSQKTYPPSEFLPYSEPMPT
jgi:hypothetical protein